MGLAGQGPQRGGRVQRVARAISLRRAGREAAHELVMDVAVHQQARAGVADLAGVVINAAHRPVHRRVQVVQVGQKNLRAFAARFQGYPLHVGLPGIGQQQLAHGGGAGERQLDHIWVQCQCPPGLRPQAIDQVEHARRATGIDEQLGQPGTRQRRLLGRFEHHAVAGRQNRRQLPHRHQQWVVPGRDGAHHAHGFMRDQVQAARCGMGDCAFHLVNALGKKTQGLGDFRQVDVEHIADRLAHVERLQQGQFVGMLLDQIGQAQQHIHALPGG